MNKQKFRNKYRTQSIRLKKWDYGWNAAYFVTICTKHKKYFLGKIIEDNMQLSTIGIVAEKCWKQIPDHFPFVQLDQFVIMPNHIHGIIIINKEDDRRDVEAQGPESVKSLNKFGGQSKNLASIIRGFKIGVTKEAHQTNPNFAWQARFYDRVIRNNNELEKIQIYIHDNPLNWKKDKLNIEK
ncbi:hypothetical protein EMN47_06925 [Prolixibacteraceae bacterium JC049]|nr:hypothetical protein [Prolixibacteraceae bacterium JC049]